MKNLEIKLINKFRKRYGLFFTNHSEPIGWAEISCGEKIFEIFEMEIYDLKMRRKGYGEGFLNLLIEKLAKPKGCQEILFRWSNEELFPALKRRGFTAINQTKGGVDFIRKI
ncbi:MAG: hypothetical protein IH934_01530 [Nanoarchaeota archaeon]|nr:hypothetical protein [Nanoarchaeota archaeon]